MGRMAARQALLPVRADVPGVSVVVPCQNEAERLRRRIDALKKAAEHMGYINSPAGGIITEAALRAGDLTADGAAFIISDESS